MRRCTERRRRFPALAVLERVLGRVSVTLSKKTCLRVRKQHGRQEVHPRWSPQEDGSHRRFGVRCGNHKLHLPSTISHLRRVRREARSGKAWELSSSASYVSLPVVLIPEQANAHQRSAEKYVYERDGVSQFAQSLGTRVVSTSRTTFILCSVRWRITGTSTSGTMCENGDVQHPYLALSISLDSTLPPSTRPDDIFDRK